VSTLRHIAGIVIFVVDVSCSNGYSLEEQKSLLDSVSNEFCKRTIIVLNKTDLATEGQRTEAKKIFGGLAVEEGENIPSRLRKEIILAFKD
jgi:GTP1/Obg family GTP-binding protein